MAAVLVVAACSNNMNVDKYASPQSLYDASMAEFNKGNCTKAMQGFTRVTLDLPPRDPKAVEARFMLAECHLKKGEYLEASRQFRRVSDETPTHELAPKALLRSGDAQLELWKRVELDDTYGENAMATYRELVTRYPESQAAQEGRKRIEELSDQFAKKEFKTGEFYMRLHAFDSAILYFKDLVANYPNSMYASRALIKLIRAYRKIGYTEEIRETCTHLRRFYPDAKGLDETCPGV